MTAPDVQTQLDQWRDWLAEHRDDPAVTTGWAKVGRLLGGAE